VDAAELDDAATRQAVVVHVAFSDGEYLAGHVPGSRFVPFQAYAPNAPGSEGLRTELPPLDSLQRVLERAGLTADAPIVIVGQPIPAARFLLTLAYVGLDARAVILDGGIDAWREAGRPLERDIPIVAPTSLRLEAHPEVFVTADELRQLVATRGAAIVDARTPEFYLGVSANGFPRAGHIAGAVNVPFASLTREVSRLRDRATLDRLFAQAGVPAGAPVVTYCHVGQQASLAWLAARLSGRAARLYDGSFQEWSRLADAPVETTSRP
jgi:thiosulfate/3-mercaptopyruvate sulfurtransferase